jgi:hypothetical protein
MDRSFRCPQVGRWQRQSLMTGGAEHRLGASQNGRQVVSVSTPPSDLSKATRMSSRMPRSSRGNGERATRFVPPPIRNHCWLGGLYAPRICLPSVELT